MNKASTCIILVLFASILGLASSFTLFDPQQIVQINLQSNQFTWDSSTPPAYHYTIQGSRATRKTNGGFPQITSLLPLSQKTMITFRPYYAVKIDASIAFGLLKQSLKQTNQTTAGWKDGSLGLWSRNGGRYEQDSGSIWVDGKAGQSVKELFVRQNGKISMLVDIPNKQVVFYIEGAQVAKIEDIKWLQSGKVYVVAIAQIEGKYIEVTEVA